MSVVLKTSAASINIFYREGLLSNGWKYKIEFRPRSYDETSGGIAEAVSYRAEQIEIPDGVFQFVKTKQEYEKRKIGMPKLNEMNLTINMGILKDIYETLGAGEIYGVQLETMYQYILNNYIYADVKLADCSESGWANTHNPVINDLLLTNIFALYTDYGSGGDLELYDYYTQSPFVEIEQETETIEPLELDLNIWYKWAMEAVTWEQIYVPVVEYRDIAGVYGNMIDTRDEDTRHTARGNYYNLMIDTDNYILVQNKFSSSGYQYYAKSQDLDLNIANILLQMYEVFVAKDATAGKSITIDLSGAHKWYKQNQTSRNAGSPGTLLLDSELYFLAKTYNSNTSAYRSPNVHTYGTKSWIPYNIEQQGGFLSDKGNASFGAEWDNLYEYLQDMTAGQLLNFNYRNSIISTVDTMTMAIDTSQHTAAATFDVSSLSQSKLTKSYERLVTCETDIAGISEPGMFTEIKQKSGKSPIANEFKLPSAIFNNSPAVEWGSTETGSNLFWRNVYNVDTYSRGMFYLEQQDTAIPAGSSTTYTPVKCHNTNWININSDMYIEDLSLATGSIGQSQVVVGYDNKQQRKSYYMNPKIGHNKDLTKEKANKDLNYASPNNEIPWNNHLQQLNRYSGISNSLAIMCLMLYSRPNQALLSSAGTEFTQDLMSNKVGQHLQLTDTTGLYTNDKLEITESGYNELISCESDWESCTNAVDIYFYGEDDDDYAKNFDYENKAT